MVADLGWVDLYSGWVFHCLPNSAWADWNLAELAGQHGRESKSTLPRSQTRWDTLYYAGDMSAVTLPIDQFDGLPSDPIERLV